MLLPTRMTHRKKMHMLVGSHVERSNTGIRCSETNVSAKFLVYKSNAAADNQIKWNELAGSAGCTKREA